MFGKPSNFSCLSASPPKHSRSCFAHISPCAESGLVPFFFPSCTASKCALRGRLFSWPVSLILGACCIRCCSCCSSYRLTSRTTPPSATACRQWAALPAPLHIICLSAASPSQSPGSPVQGTRPHPAVCRVQSPTAKPCSDSAAWTLQRLPVESLCECESALCRLLC